MVYGEVLPVAAEKARLRRKFNGQWRALAPDNLAAGARQAMSHLARRPFWRQARTVMAYFALPGELPTALLIRCARLAQKRVALPRTVDGGLEARAAGGFGSLVRGSYGIWEPHPDLTSPVAVEDLDLIIVPSLAFDERGVRLGRGGGHYDRFLQQVDRRRTAVAGWTLAAFVVPQLPREPHDQRVDWLITETGAIQIPPAPP